MPGNVVEEMRRYFRGRSTRPDEGGEPFIADAPTRQEGFRARNVWPPFAKPTPAAQPAYGMYLGLPPFDQGS
jgi:hypothetical protein